MRIILTLNRKSVTCEVAPDMRLVDFLRNEMGLTGTKEGCGKGECGTCTVLLDGQPVCSCLMLCAQVIGHHIETIEGLQQNGKLHPLQEAFIEVGAVQCGFCTPGLVLSGVALLSKNPNPSEAEIRRAIAGNLCRCTGYTKVVEAIRLGAQRLMDNP